MSIDFSSVRSIPPKTKGNRGFFPSKKVPSGIIEYESQLERDFYLILEHAPDVKIYQHQPLSITYEDQYGKNKKYTPDVYVEFINGIRLLVEIKDQITLSDNYSKYKERWDKCEEWSQKRGISFIIISEGEIRTPRMANIWFTLGSSKNRSNNNYFRKITRIIPNQ